MSTILIFGGTAAYHLNPADFAPIAEQRIIETPYGPSPLLSRLTLPHHASRFTFHLWYASRHGQSTLERSAAFVNHRANLWAAHSVGASLILSWNGVGAINPTLRVGDTLVPAAIMDWTRNRIPTFAEAAPFPDNGRSLRAAARTIDHINNGRDPLQVAHPFHQPTRQLLLNQLEAEREDSYSVLPIPYLREGNTQYAIRNTSPIQNPTYVCTEGPRLETAAEIQLAADLGADIVGMTLCPEVWLAAELGIPYASLCLITNFATGRKHHDPRRDFGPSVAQRGLRLLLAVAQEWTE